MLRPMAHYDPAQIGAPPSEIRGDLEFEFYRYLLGEPKFPTKNYRFIEIIVVLKIVITGFYCMSIDDRSPANQIFQAPSPCDHAIPSRDDHW
ncbi:hypothetical protein E4U26_006589 [Claviceps purpurea]|nr:hypothetical protein E4U26_006589 [Claviceps purpurea]